MTRLRRCKPSLDAIAVGWRHDPGTLPLLLLAHAVNDPHPAARDLASSLLAEGWANEPQARILMEQSADIVADRDERRGSGRLLPHHDD